MKTSDIFKLSQNELYDLFGVELQEDGSVYDPIEDKTFATLAVWKSYADDQEQDDHYGSFQKFGGKYAYDDYEY
jgi:hypothetical protein